MFPLRSRRSSLIILLHVLVVVVLLSCLADVGAEPGKPICIGKKEDGETCFTPLYGGLKFPPRKISCVRKRWFIDEPLSLLYPGGAAIGMTAFGGIIIGIGFFGKIRYDRHKRRKEDEDRAKGYTFTEGATATESTMGSVMGASTAGAAPSTAAAPQNAAGAPGSTPSTTPSAAPNPQATPAV